VTRIVQRSFAGGEIAPELYGQVDQDLYQASAKTLENVLVTKDGSLRKRSGLEYVADLDATTGFRVLRFGAADGSDFVVVLASNGAVQIFRDGVEQSVGTIPAWDPGTLYAPYQLVTRDSTVYYALGWTDGDPLVGGWDAEDPPLRHPFGGKKSLAAIQWAQVGDVLTVTNRAGGIWQLLRTSYGWNARTPEIPDVGHRDFYSGNDIYFAANTIAPSRLENEWHSARDWTWIVTAVVKRDGMWRETGTQEAISLSCAMATDFYPRLLIWTKGSSTEECYYRVYRGYNGLYGLVGETSPQPNDACMFWDEGREPDVTQQPPARLGDPSLYSDASGYPGADESTLKPAALAFWQQRMVLGGFDEGPANLLLSNAGQIQDFLVNPLLAPNDDDGIDVALSAVEHEEIRAIVPAAELLVFTSRGEWAVWGEGDAVAPRTLRAKRNSGRGIGNVPPLSIGSHLLFISRSGAIYALAKNSDSGAWDQADLTARASHLLDGHTIVDWAYQQRPDSVVWCVRDDGVLLSMTYRPEAGIVAWAKHTTKGLVKAVGVVDEGYTDTVYCAVHRTTTGPTLERMRDVLRPGHVSEAVHLDGSVEWPDEYGATPGVPATGSFYPIGTPIGSAEMAPAVSNYNRYMSFRIYGTAREDMEDLVFTCTDGPNNMFTLTVADVTYPEAAYTGGLQPLTDFCSDPVVRGLCIQHIYDLSEPAEPFHTGDFYVQSISAGLVTETPRSFVSIRAPDALAGQSVTVLEYGTLSKGKVGGDGSYPLTDPDAGRVVFGLPYTSTVEMLDAYDKAGVRMRELTWMSVRAETAGAPALFASAAVDEGGQAEEESQGDGVAVAGDVSRRTVEGTLSHALEEEVAGAIVQTLPYPLRILRVTRDVSFEQNL
jgi:hypothetical protein